MHRPAVCDACDVTTAGDIEAVLGLRVWAVVGCSPDPSRDSHRIAALLLKPANG